MHEQFYMTAFVSQFMYFAINKLLNVAVLSKVSLFLVLLSQFFALDYENKNQCKTSKGNINFYVLSYPKKFRHNTIEISAMKIASS